MTPRRWATRLRGAGVWVRDAAMFVLSAAIAISLLVMLVIPGGGRIKCPAAVRTALEGGVITRATFTRSYAEHWAAAAVVRPLDLAAEPYTVVCHFGGKNYAGPRLETVAGDRFDAFVDATESNWNPLTWRQ